MLREHNEKATIVTTPWGELTGEQLKEAMEGGATIAKIIAAIVCVAGIVFLVATYGDKLVAKIRELAPTAKIVVQETWSYTPWDRRLGKWKIDQNEMYERLHDAYADFASMYSFDVIPMGTAIQQWRRQLPVKYTENSYGGDVVGGAQRRRCICSNHF